MFKLFFKVSLYTKSMFNYVLFSFFWFRKRDQNLLSSDSNIIVSLTTYGGRIDLVHLTLRSILSQSSSPKKIYLWLSSANFPNEIIPKSLRLLERNGVSIRFVSEDLRSYKKIYYTYELEKDNECYIVTADDDVYYPINWLRDIESEINKNNNLIYCYRAQKILFKSEFEVDRYDKWTLYNSDNATHSILPTGVSGICYPIRSLKGVTDLLFLEVCPTADDIWLRFITHRNGFKCKLVDDTSIHFVPVILPFTMPKKGLEQHNVLNDLNSLSFNRCLNAFGLSKKDFEI